MAGKRPVIFENGSIGESVLTAGKERYVRGKTKRVGTMEIKFFQDFCAILKIETSVSKKLQQVKETPDWASLLRAYRGIT